MSLNRFRFRGAGGTCIYDVVPNGVAYTLARTTTRTTTTSTTTHIDDDAADDDDDDDEDEDAAEN
ncbi:hypothetical protein LX36DRAFT_716318 [Colletotrichum falcatum]|nr:hypothetical protein LX36DRAFT_716318 [Colletotrichum falcatum]